MKATLFTCILALLLASATLAEPPQAPVRLLSRIDVKDFGAETLRMGDLDGDGKTELLFVQCVRATREITCLTATDLFGRVLWQKGQASADHGTIYSDLPVQIDDFDDDGRNEVLYVRQAKYVAPPWDGRSPRERADRYEGNATMVVLDGATGTIKRTFPLPAPADDCFLFADLTGRGRRADLVVKDRYWNIWGVSYEGKTLWHWRGSVGHFPSVADVDGDGRDEVFVGFALLDHDGKPIFSHPDRGAHQDACVIVRGAQQQWRLLFGNSGIHCLDIGGRTLWEHPLGEAQHVVSGRFVDRSPMQFVVVDRTPEPSHRRDENAWGILYLYDADGKELWRRKQEKGDWAIAPLKCDWFGQPRCDAIFVYGRGPGRPTRLYNGAGDIIATLPMEYTPDRTEADRRADYYGLVANVWGDSREEILLFGSRGACIYTNPRSYQPPSQSNETLYPGM